MSCHARREGEAEEANYTVALAGNPNVGKSILFSKITGVYVDIGNYPGKTVQLNEGIIELGGRRVKFFDTPGTYSLSPISEDQAIATSILSVRRPDLVVAVVDSTNLERNLILVTQLLRSGFRLVIALNMVDCAAKMGIYIDHNKLSHLLGVPVVPTVATKHKGIERLLTEISEELERSSSAHQVGQSDILHATPRSGYTYSDYDRIREIAGTVTTRIQTPVTLSEKLKLYSVAPLTGFPMLVIVVVLIIGFMSSVGTWLSDGLTFLWARLVSPVLSSIAYWAAGDQPIIARIALWGFDAGIIAALAVGIPFVVTFYLALAVLEDTGYVNSLAFLTDAAMRKLGLHGRSIIPLLTGAGCNVPAILATRVLQTRRERIITSALITLVPCSARTAVIIGVVAALLGWTYAGAILGIDLGIIFAIGLVLNRTLPGSSSGLVMEVFPFRMPHLSSMLRKTWVRFKGFLIVALPVVTIGSMILGALYETDAVWILVNPTAPLIEGFLGLPLVAGVCLLLGILRKELTIQLLLAIAVVQYGPAAANLLAFMAPLQIFVFALVVTLYFPCIATAAVMVKELGWTTTLLSMALTVSIAFLVGGIAFQTGIRLGVT